jgi:hypothetical protein
MSTRRDRKTHKRVIVGAFTLGICCSILALCLLFVYSKGLQKSFYTTSHTRSSLPPRVAHPS